MWGVSPKNQLCLQLVHTFDLRRFSLSNMSEQSFSVYFFHLNYLYSLLLNCEPLLKSISIFSIKGDPIKFRKQRFLFIHANLLIKRKDSMKFAYLQTLLKLVYFLRKKYRLKVGVFAATLSKSSITLYFTNLHLASCLIKGLEYSDEQTVTKLLIKINSPLSVYFFLNLFKNFYPSCYLSYEET